MDIYLVGGAVRDALLGREVAERDWLVVGATPAEMRARGFVPADDRFPVFRHPETGEEYALARRERKVAPGHKGFELESGPDVTLEEDLERRDLTINAMARAEDGELKDTRGGRTDLEARRLRHVTPAFVDDPLRCLRAARFHSLLAPLGFEVEEETLALMSRMARSGELETLAPEHLWRETEKAMAGPDPGRYFATLAGCGALAPILGVAELELGPGPRATPAPGSAATVALGACLLGALQAAPGATSLCARVDAALGRLGPPRRVVEVVLLAADTLEALRREPQPDAGGLLGVLDRLDAWRRPERAQAVLAILADAGPARPPGKALAMLARAHAAGARTDVGRLRDQGIAGRELGEALARERLRVIETALDGEEHP